MLWISIHLPFHDLDANMPQWRINSPLAAVLHDGRVKACTPDACKTGVRLGMSHNAAAAMAAGIRFVQHDPKRTQHRLEAVAMTLLQYTPELALFDSSSLLLEVGASLSLFKGPRKLYKRIRNSLRLIGAQARISMAPTATGAWLMACQEQTRQRRSLSMRSLTHHVNALHVSTMPVARPYLTWLNAIGCTTLGDLNQLPRSGLIQRTSLQLMTCLDAAYGKTTTHLKWYQPPDIFHASSLLGFHTMHAHALLTAAQGLVEQLCGWLQARHQAASALQFSLHHEKGRHACPPTGIVLNLSTPSRHAENFLLLLKEHLQHERLQAPVIALDLHNVQSEPQCDPSGDLFPDRTQCQHQENKLIDLLCARLGQNNILQPHPIASHLPECANHWVSVDHKPERSGILYPDATTSGQAARSGYSPDAHHPFWLLETPMKLVTDNDHPIYLGHALHLIHGPERIESGWWKSGRHEQRDYFVASDSQHCRYWIYRQRGSDNPHWFLHGLFA